MSKMVERLVGLKYLRRSTSAKDRRQHVLQLSPKGAKAVQKVRSQVARRLQERLDKLPISEQKKISQALKSLNDLFALNLENTL